MATTYLIYAFIDETETPFYIGKTKDLRQRIKDHKYEIKKGNKLPKYNKVRKLERNGFDFAVKVIEDDIKDSSTIDERERYWIKKFRDDGITIYNLTDGGDGGDTKMPKEHYEKMSKLLTTLWKDPEMRKRWIDSRTGLKRSKESRKRMSEARKGIKFSDEHKKNLSIARKKRVITNETRKKCSKTSTGKINIKKFEITDPNGNKYITDKGLTDFCRQHDLAHPLMIKVANGERRHHKNWTCKRLD